jgi:thiol:disulfide interchange protein DsbD
MRAVLAAILIVGLAPVARAQFGDTFGNRAAGLDDVLSRIEARFEPATAKPGDSVTWIMTVEVVPGWHTYPTVQTDPEALSNVVVIKFPKTGNLTPTGPIIEPSNPIEKAYPELKIKKAYEYEGTVVWSQRMTLGNTTEPGPLVYKVPVTFLVCKENCIREKRDVAATLTVRGEPHVNGSSPPVKATSTPRTAVDDEADAIGSTDHKAALNAILGKIGKQRVEPNTGLASFLLTAAFWGAITLFTPCVFPMIPITVSFFLKQAEKNHGNALKLAIIYCGTIIVVLGAAALTLLEFFTLLSINPWMNILLGSLFVVLALSLFGMFELTLPNFLTRFTSAREGQGGVIGTVFMALTFPIVSFTCVAPFLGGFGGMASSGQFRTWELILGAGAFAGTFAAPFFLLALFPSLLKRLPKSGGWLNTVKIVMGFLELAAALKFFRTAELIHSAQPSLFTFDLVLGMLIALSLLCGLYLINVFRLPHDEPHESVSVPRMLVGFLFISMALYMSPALFAFGPNGEKQRPRGSV